MTGAWTLDAFLVGSVVLVLVPLGVYIYREFLHKGSNGGDK